MEKKIVVADSNLLAQFASIANRATLEDGTGQTVGVLLSPDEFERMRRDAGEIDFTPEYFAEVDRCVAEGRYKTTAEVLAMLSRFDKAIAGNSLTTHFFGLTS